LYIANNPLGFGFRQKSETAELLKKLCCISVSGGINVKFIHLFTFSSRQLLCETRKWSFRTPLYGSQESDLLAYHKTSPLEFIVSSRYDGCHREFKWLFQQPRSPLLKIILIKMGYKYEA
jgi:hypothetical protein